MNVRVPVALSPAIALVVSPCSCIRIFILFDTLYDMGLSWVLSLAGSAIRFAAMMSRQGQDMDTTYPNRKDQQLPSVRLLHTSQAPALPTIP